MLPLAFEQQFEQFIQSQSAQPYGALSLPELKASWHRLSESYRTRKNGYTQKKGEHIAYILARMPATFAACADVIKRGQELGIPLPQTLLDLGSGPGTMAWALSMLPALRLLTLTQVEADDDFVSFCGKVRPDAFTITTHHGTPFSQQLMPHDWVTMAYVLCEQSEAHQKKWLIHAWGLTKEALIIIQPGTPDGFRQLMSARDHLLANGGHVLAPCPHHRACPLQPHDWCHFSVRLQRTFAQRYLKSADLGYEDEKYSYLIITKSPALSLMKKRPRIIRHPLRRSGHVRLDLCTPEGLQQEIVSARNKPRYRQVRAAAWGDVWPPLDGEES